MRTYGSADELCDEITKRAALFIAEFTSVPAGAWDTSVEGVDRSPRQMLAYQLGWMDLLLGWERTEQSGLEAATPAAGYKWNQLGSLYTQFYADWAAVPPAELIHNFNDRVTQMCDWVRSLGKTVLFEPKQRQWASATPSAWPVWKWVHINTVAPFTTFRTKIRKWKKLLRTS